MKHLIDWIHLNLAIIISVIAIIISLKERKRGLSSVVYETQIQACIEITDAFGELDQIFHGWVDLKEQYHNHREPYSKQTADAITSVYSILRTKCIVLPNRLIHEFTVLMHFYIREQEKMVNEKDYAADKNDLFIKFAELQNKIRNEFGIEKLSASNKTIAGITTPPKNVKNQEL